MIEKKEKEFRRSSLGSGGICWNILPIETVMPPSTMLDNIESPAWEEVVNGS